MKRHIKRLHEGSKRIARKVTRRKGSEPIIPESAVPRITNETIAEHREQVLSGARKYIYPLQHSKHRIVLISTGIFMGLLIVFFSYCTLALYKFQSTSTFIYRVTQVIPFPIAHSKAGFVSYESYLFELRHYMHYYETQQKLSFKTETGEQQLANYKKQALDRVINDSYVKELARKNGVGVTNQEVDGVMATVRNQNRLGTNDKVFEDVLSEFWGWSINDFKRSLRQQLLAQKVVSKLDTDTHARAKSALAELSGGAPFADTAKKYSDDENTKAAGGDFGAPIDRTNRELSAETVDELYKLSSGQISGIIDIGYGLEILKHYGLDGEKVKGAHILFKFKDINEYINPLKDKQKTRQFVRVG
jgi:parvulin-like peptidyl-prolyl isomerase